MISYFKKYFIKLLNKKGFINSKDYNSVIQLYTSYLKNNKDKNPEEIISIVFSKDRAMQLHAFINSYIKRINNRAPLYVLYAVSSPKHDKSYNDLINIIRKTTAGKILFFVDDMIFTHDFDFNILKIINTSEYIVSLTRGEDMAYSIVLQKKLTLPSFQKHISGMIYFKWDEIKEFSDWTYPLGVSGYMYGKNEILSMFDIIQFKAPNSLESSMQTYYNLFKKRLGLCTNNAIAVCIHANIVQSEGYNPVIGSYSINELLEFWEANKQIDITPFYNKSMMVTQVMEYSFLNRDSTK